MPKITDAPHFINNGMLKEIRDHTDWRALFAYLGLTRDRKSTESDWWAVSPLNPEEKHASFHINDKGWTCFSTDESGYVIELVQKVMEYRTGRALNCYEAGKWLLENGLSRVSIRSGTGSPPLAESHAGCRGNGWRWRRETRVTERMNVSRVTSGMKAISKGKRKRTGRSGRLCCRHSFRSIRNSNGGESRGRHANTWDAAIFLKRRGVLWPAGSYFRCGE